MVNKKSEKDASPNIFPDVTNDDDDTSTDNRLPVRNKKLGILGDDNPKTASDFLIVKSSLKKKKILPAERKLIH